MADVKDKWEEYYFTTFYYRIKNETFGYLIIPENCIVNGLNIGLWEKEQRKLFEQRELPYEKVKLLRSLKFKWMKDYDTNDLMWLEKYDELKEYYKSNNNELIFSNTKDYVVKSLCNWVWYQKKQYQKGELVQWKIDLLNKLGVDWTIKNNRNTTEEKKIYRWNDYYKMAKQFYETNGHLVIDKDYIKDNRALGKWIVTQRNNYLKEDGEPRALTTQQVEQLEEIHMLWSVNFKTKFETTLKLLQEYIREYGSLKGVNKDTIYKEYKLGYEALVIRHKIRSGELYGKEVLQLKKLGLYKFLV